MSSSDANSSYADLVRDFLLFLRRNKREILISIGIAVVIAVLAVHFSHLKYRAEVMVAPQEGMSASGSLANLSDLAGLAGSVGGGLGGDGGSSFQPFLRFTQTITNDTVANALAKQPWVLPAVFPKNWDAENKSWHPANGLKGTVEALTVYLFGLEAWHPPDARDLQKFLDKSVNVVKFGRYPAYTISVEWRSAASAARLLQSLLATNDSIIQTEAQIRLTRTTAYLEQRLNTETQLDRRNALNMLLLEQERQLMVAETKGPYAAKIIDQPTVSDVYTPKILAGSASFFLGFLLSFYGFIVFRRMRNGTRLLAAVKLSGSDRQFGLPRNTA